MLQKYEILLTDALRSIPEEIRHWRQVGKNR